MLSNIQDEQKNEETWRNVWGGMSQVSFHWNYCCMWPKALRWTVLSADLILSHFFRSIVRFVASLLFVTSLLLLVCAHWILSEVPATAQSKTGKERESTKPPHKYIAFDVKLRLYFIINYARAKPKNSLYLIGIWFHTAYFVGNGERIA